MPNQIQSPITEFNNSNIGFTSTTRWDDWVLFGYRWLVNSYGLAQIVSTATVGLQLDFVEKVCLNWNHHLQFIIFRLHFPIEIPASSSFSGASMGLSTALMDASICVLYAIRSYLWSSCCSNRCIGLPLILFIRFLLTTATAWWPSGRWIINKLEFR